jgi:TetR/AcrR family transcriptional regulator, mexJK operon transcriptional repressor
MTFDATFTDVLPEQSRDGSLKGKRRGDAHGDVNTPVVPSSMRGRKRLARIMEAAAELFLRDGYFATSIEAVLEASGGSKATLYSYFSTKDDLFRAVIEEAILSDIQPRLEVRSDVKSTLTEYVVRTFEAMSSPRHRALLRLTIAERERFPDLARRYYESGPLRSRRVLAQFFRELEQQRALPQGAADEAADYFVGLITHHWLLESLLFGDDRLPAPEVVRARAVQAVERFLASTRRG